ncbi:hypothetical protein [Haloglomus litoreum]|uniref:hypothetical protein n=1 Tax=Haloglomus litoreum TaxID=3034026 RepID=UPI0023E8F20D|nr:hypothetical protein [Haloglomus sp. DT116]
MRADALRTAVTLYETGTVDIAGAARSVGVSPARMRRCLRANGVSVGTGDESHPASEPAARAR